MAPDNRIPDVLQKKGQKKGNNEHYIEFQDWIENKEHESRDWIVVGRALKHDDERGDLFTYSALLLNAEDVDKKIVSENEWEVHQDSLGIPRWEEHFHPVEEKIFNFCEQETTEDGLSFKPFIFIRTRYDDTVVLELTQTFVLFYEAYFDYMKKEYMREDEDGDIIPIARLVDEDRTLLVDAKYLRDFLSQSRSILVRFHDLRRKVAEHLETDTKFVRDDKRNYEISFTNVNFFEEEIGTRSFLVGKDIILPYPEPYTSARF